MLTKTLPIFTLAAALAGCSFAPIGENTFNCNRKDVPTSPYCRSFKAVEKSTSGTLPESRFDKEFKMSDYDRATGIAPDGDAVDAPAPSAKGKLTLPHNASGHGMSGDVEAMSGSPVRRAPVIQRVWIKRFVDENDMLQSDTVVHKEVQSSKWTGFDETKANNLAGTGAVFPHRASQDVRPSAVETSAPANSNDFSQPSSTGESDETGSRPPASGASMPQ